MKVGDSGGRFPLIVAPWDGALPTFESLSNALVDVLYTLQDAGLLTVFLEYCSRAAVGLQQTRQQPNEGAIAYLHRHRMLQQARI